MRLFPTRRQSAPLPDPSPSLDEMKESSYPAYPNNPPYQSISTVPPRTDSFPKPPSSVEPPQIRPYMYADTPGPQPVIGHLSAIRENERIKQRPQSPFNLQLRHARQLDSRTQEPGIMPYVKGETSIQLPSVTTNTGSIVPRQPYVERQSQSSLLALDTDPSKPAPPSDVVQQVLATRLPARLVESGGFDGVEVTPPVRLRTPPPAIYIDYGNPSQGASTNSNVNTSTWISSPREPTLLPPVNQKPMLTPGATTDASPTAQHPSATPCPAPAPLPSSAYDTHRPTCSLNIVCYRGGTEGCILRQIQTAHRARFAHDASFRETLARNPQLVTGDEEFFHELRRLYWGDMCGFWCRNLSLKTLTGFRLLTYSPSRRPTVVALDDYILQEIFHAYKRPRSVTSQDDWIQWVFRLRRGNKRHALEFVEGWNSTRIMVAAAVPWLVSCLVGIIWTAAGRDAQTAFTVASFILTSGTVVLALLAVISGIESSGRSVAMAG